MDANNAPTGLTNLQPRPLRYAQLALAENGPEVEKLLATSVLLVSGVPLELLAATLVLPVLILLLAHQLAPDAPQTLTLQPLALLAV